jgi:dihydroorotase
MSHSVFIKNARLFAPGHELHRREVDLLVVDGKLHEIGENLMSSGNEYLDMSGYWVSAGWVDPYGVCPEPGEPWKETIVSYTRAAQIGGFTDVYALAGSSPKPDNESVIAQVRHQGRNQRATLHPIGLASVKGEGKEMAEVAEMAAVGATAFCDGMQASSSAGLRQKLMQYCNSLGLIYMNYPLNRSLSTEGKIHEGIVNLHLGLKGISTIAETIELSVDLHLAQYNQTQLRSLGLSAAESVQMIKGAKEAGLAVKGAVAVLNLYAVDEDIAEFDENLKVLPPLRSDKDRSALRQAVLDGVIDAVFSNHHPEDIESKKVEFDYSAWGAATLSYTFPMLLEVFGEATMDIWLLLLTKKNAEFIGAQPHEIAVGSDAIFTFFSTKETTEITAGKHGSIAWNVPFMGRILPGRIKGTMIHSCYMEAKNV